MLTDSQLQALYRYGCTLTNDEQLGHDLLHDAIETCLRQPPDSLDKLPAYLRKIMRNRFFDLVRHQQRFPQDVLEEQIVGIDMNTRQLEDVIIDEVDLDAIWLLLQPVEREILFLWAIEGYTTNEIADHLDMPKGTVLSKIHRLRIRMEQEQGGYKVRGEVI